MVMDGILSLRLITLQPFFKHCNANDRSGI